MTPEGDPDRLRNAKARLALRVVDSMYQDPFWVERFGARGRKRSEEDLGYHVDYLAQAIDGREVAVMERYARWLQGVLTTRGMCSLHLAESFDELERAIHVELPELAARSSVYLAASRAALLYAPGTARTVQEAAPRLASSITIGGARHVVSYLADALALDQPSVLAAHVVWLANFLAGRGVDRGMVAEAIASLRRQVEDDPSFSPDDRARCAAVLGPAAKTAAAA